MANASAEPLTTPLYDLHLELGARMVDFAGYSMPVQYPAGLLAEHRHTREAAGLFDISHMGQLELVGPEAAMAAESLIPADIVDLAVGKQRYGLLLGADGGILDDLMVFKQAHDRFLVVVNGACKSGDLAYLESTIGSRCEVRSLPDRALLALQGPLAAATLAALSPNAERFVFMTGGEISIDGIDALVTRSGYTGEDGFEISVVATDAEPLARLLLDQPAVQPIGLGARNSLRLEAGLCLYGRDMDASVTPIEASLGWAIPKIRRAGGARAGGFPGFDRVTAQIAASAAHRPAAEDARLNRQRVGILALDRIPVRDDTALQSPNGTPIGFVTSGLLSPTLNRPIAMGYVLPEFVAPGARLQAVVRGNPVPMEVSKIPFVNHRYFRG